MKPGKKAKTHAAKSKHRTASKLPMGMQETHEVSKREARRNREPNTNTYTPMETGQPDEDIVVGMTNPSGAQGGRGPTNQEGEGERQNSQLAELEQIEPNVE